MMGSPWRKVGVTALVIAALSCIGYVWFILAATRAAFEGLKGNGVEAQRSNAYVSDNPALSTNAALAVGVLDAYRKYGGVPPATAKEVRYAYRPYKFVVRFKLSETDLARFLRGKTKDAASAAGLYGDLDYEGVAEVFPFFSRLGWWPIPAGQAGGYEVYIGRCWRTSEYFVAHDEYTLLVNHRAGVVYLVAFPSD